MGRKLGFDVIYEYRTPNLVKAGRTSYIDVVWISQGEIQAAFEIRRKTEDLDIPTSSKDKTKLLRLSARKRYLVNVSENTGNAYFHEVL
jgi:hypothetical protein